MSVNDQRQRRIEIQNALAQMSNTLYGIQHGKDSWDLRIKAMTQLRLLIPLIIRYMIYFKNLEESK